MKRILMAAAAIMLLMTMNMMAEPVSPSVARQAAARFLQGKGGKTVYADFVELTNALIVIGSEASMEELMAYLNADYKKVEEQMAQSKKLPTVLVKSAIVGNHRYSVPEFAKWADIVEANEKSFAVDASTDCIVSLAAKAKKVGGLFLAMDGSTPVTPVVPE